MIHRTYYSPMQATSERLQSATNAAILDDRRIEAILQREITLTPEQKEAHRFADVWLSADEALAAKIVTNTGSFDIPPKIQIFNLSPV